MNQESFLALHIFYERLLCGFELTLFWRWFAASTYQLFENYDE
jgi:hypothetical protein